MSAQDPNKGKPVSGTDSSQTAPAEKPQIASIQFGPGDPSPETPSPDTPSEPAVPAPSRHAGRNRPLLIVIFITAAAAVLSFLTLLGAFGKSPNSLSVQSISYASSSAPPASSGTIKTKFLPSWLPGGYAESSYLEATRSFTVTYSVAGRQDLDILYTQFVGSMIHLPFAPGAVKSTVTINGCAGRCSAVGGSCSLSWYDGEYSYSLSGAAAESDLIRMAESLQEAN